MPLRREFRGRWPVTNADQVRAYLATQDVPCPDCGYCLRGLRDPVCPECGRSLEIKSLHGGRSWLIRTGLGQPSMTPAALVNIALAAAVIVSAPANRAALPLLAWLAPAVLGAFACSLAYWPVLLKYESSSIETPQPVIGAAWIIAVVQCAALVLLWA